MTQQQQLLLLLLFRLRELLPAALPAVVLLGQLNGQICLSTFRTCLQS
jgi:hypothetical protein